MFVKSYLSSGVAPGRSWFVGRATRGDDKPRGRGRGRRNTKIIVHDGEMEMSRYNEILASYFNCFTCRCRCL